YKGQQKFAVNWPPLHHVKQREKDLIEVAGGLDTTEASVGWTNPAMAFGLYVRRLVETAWWTTMPDDVDVVIVADGGGG
uniref:Terminase n=1 Tax=Bursaphelenchus xylophilus TaxID=6326 RepID=A0A1I7SPA1_BURXY